MRGFIGGVVSTLPIVFGGAFPVINRGWFPFDAAQRISPLRTKFSPPVPQIVNRVPKDPDADFYWITKHGIRLTGMPGWDGILSDDQIWTVVAFIKRSDKLPAEAEAAWKQAAGVVASGTAPSR